jgi:hypothetical protein
VAFVGKSWQTSQPSQTGWISSLFQSAAPPGRFESTLSRERHGWFLFGFIDQEILFMTMPVQAAVGAAAVGAAAYGAYAPPSPACGFHPYPPCY